MGDASGGFGDVSRGLRDVSGGLRDASALAVRLKELLEVIYPGRAEEVCERLLEVAQRYREQLSSRQIAPPTAGTSCLITYADAVRREGEHPLHTLDEVLRKKVGDTVSDVHLLPMFPWTSDDGFAVVDFRQINPELGNWEDVATLSRDYALVFDFVANHVSASSPWFTGWLAGDPRYADFFITKETILDTAHVVRPRTTALFHDYQRTDGTTVSAWTTFGPDQIDLNAANPAVLVELTDVLLGYLARGASTIRLDAIGFLWKESGTTCLHLPQTHAIIKVWRALVDELSPGAQLLTETNVPHAENISYFGTGHDEAHQVYQFALPPLVLHAFVVGSTTKLASWAHHIGPVSSSATWFNFLSSHDGIGLRPTEGILTDDDRRALVDRTLAHGGVVSMAGLPDGSERVYELNINYLDALSAPEEVGDAAVVSAKGLAAHSILLSVVGVPAIYYHTLFGSSSDREGVRVSGIARRINREPLAADTLLAELTTDDRRRLIFEGLCAMLDVRREQAGFSPYADQLVEHHDPRVFVVRRAAGSPDEVVAATNVSGEEVSLPHLGGFDLLTGRTCDAVTLPPYGYAWLVPEAP